MTKREKREARKQERLEQAAAKEAARRAAEHRVTRSQQCPNCGKNTAARYLYGLPLLDRAMREEIDAGLIVLAGSSFAGSDPRWVCLTCKHKWGRFDTP